MRRLRDEEGSRFACGQVLHQRYLLQRLLGKGGFSEVFQVGFLRTASRSSLVLCRLGDQAAAPCHPVNEQVSVLDGPASMHGHMPWSSVRPASPSKVHGRV